MRWARKSTLLEPSQNFTPIPNFTGLFDGQGQTIANLTIASTAENVGLFGSIGGAGVVRNLNLADVTVSGPGSQFVGTLAGTNAGTISNVSATGKCRGQRMQRGRPGRTKPGRNRGCNRAGLTQSAS